MESSQDFKCSLLWLKSDCENDEADTSVEIRLEINKLPGQL